MIIDGFLGSRADIVVDIVVVVFIALPFLLMAAFRLASRGKHRAHRNLQVVLLLSTFLVILLLEIDIRFSDLMANARQSRFYGSRLLSSIFVVHLAVAVGTFVSWLTLAVTSWRRFRGILPGSFSASHQLWGKGTLAGVVLTSITGMALYAMVFVL